MAKRPKRKVAIVGKAPSSALLAPFEDESWEIWILNTLGFNNEVPRWDRQFELHELRLTKAPEYGKYYDWLQVQKRPVYLRDDPPEEFANGVRYPLADVLDEFCHLAGGNYLTNSVSMEIALALLEHRRGERIEQLGLWGVDMAQHGLQTGHAGWFTSEYARQRPSCEYWIGIAEGMGIRVTIPDTSDLLKTACIYGYHTTARFEKFEARRKELRQRIAAAQQNEQNGRDERCFFSGVRHKLVNPQDPLNLAEVDKKIAAAQQKEQHGHDEALFLAGAAEGMNYDEQWLGG